MPAPPQYRQSIEYYNETKERSDYTAYTPNELSNSLHYLFHQFLEDSIVEVFQQLLVGIRKVFISTLLIN